METFADYSIYVPPGSYGNIKTTCPECSHARKKSTDKCLSVHIDKETWNCHHCGWAGGLSNNGNKFAMQTPEKSARVEKPEVCEPLSQEALAFFQERMITKEALEVAGVWEERGWLKFPYYHKNKLVNIKSRKLDSKSFHMEKGAERVPYGMDVARQDNNDTLIWTEGEMDVLTLYSCCIYNTVSVPNGAPSENTKNYTSILEFVDRCSDFISLFSFHIIAGDNDAPGRKLSDELARKLGTDRCRRVHWPDGCKDANDVLMEHGEEKVKECLESASYFPVKGIWSSDEISTDAVRIYKEKNPGGVSTGYPKELDPYYTVKPGEITIITGIPSHGKSTFLDNLMVNIAKKEGWKFAVCSTEIQPPSRHLGILIGRYLGKPFETLAPDQRMTDAELAVGLVWGNRHFTFISPDETQMNVDSVIELAKIIMARQKIHGLVIDPWGDLIQVRGHGVNEAQYTSESLSKLRNLARKNDIHVFLVAHPKNLVRNLDGTFPVPTPYDVSGGAAFRNKADCFICVWRDDTESINKSHIYIQKIRWEGVVGKKGTAVLFYSPRTGRFSESAD